MGGTTAGTSGSSGTSGSAGNAGAEAHGGSPQDGGASGVGGDGDEGGSGGEAGAPLAAGGAGAGGEGGDVAQAGSDAGGAGGEGGAPTCVPSGDERCDGLDNDCTGGVDDGAICPANCYGFADDYGHGYMICGLLAGRNQADAQAFCQAHDLSFNLVRIDSSPEHNDLVNAILALDLGTARYWIGATDMVENHWVWMDGTEFYDHSIAMTVNGGYENWALNRPNNNGNEDCAVIEIEPVDPLLDQMWNDIQCMDAGPGFICESSD